MRYGNNWWRSYLYQPGMSGTSLEDKLPTTTPTGFQVNEGTDLNDHNSGSVLQKYIHLVSPDMLRDKSVAGREHVLLSPVEEEDDVVLEGLLGLHKHLQHLQHDCAGDGIVACS